MSGVSGGVLARPCPAPHWLGSVNFIFLSYLGQHKIPYSLTRALYTTLPHYAHPTRPVLSPENNLQICNYLQCWLPWQAGPGSPDNKIKPFHVAVRTGEPVGTCLTYTKAGNIQFLRSLKTSEYTILGLLQNPPIRRIIEEHRRFLLRSWQWWSKLVIKLFVSSSWQRSIPPSCRSLSFIEV